MTDALHNARSQVRHLRGVGIIAMEGLEAITSASSVLYQSRVIMLSVAHQSCGWQVRPPDLRGVGIMAMEGLEALASALRECQRKVEELRQHSGGEGADEGEAAQQPWEEEDEEEEGGEQQMHPPLSPPSRTPMGEPG
jgi:hypothetical protein